MNLLFCINRKFLSIFLCCIKSIVLHGGYDHYEIYVVQSFFDQAMIDAISQDFKDSITFHFIRVSDDLFEGFPETDRYPREIYYHLAATLYLPENLDRILYLDADTVVINPLKDLYETDFEGNYYAGCTHTRELLTKINRTRLKTSKDAAYINTGVLLMNLPALRKNLRICDICDYVHQQKHALLLPDQDILSALYGDKVKLMDTMRFNLSEKILAWYNAAHRSATIDLPRIRENCSIIHYCGKRKPWNDDYLGILDIFYREIMPGTSK